MPTPPSLPLRVAALAAVLAAAPALGGCASSTPGAAGDRSASAPRSGAGGAAADAPDVTSVQLYAGADETAMPVIALGGGDALTLEFDVLHRDDARPLSVYLVHTDRTGRSDLFPAQFVRGFDRIDLVQPDRSRGTTVGYVHYRHRVPDAQAQLLVSGAYRVRVTELGNPDRVLFERPFYVAETNTAVETGVYGSGMALGAGLFLPLVRVSTVREASGSPFGYTACFALDGRLDATACSDRPVTTSPTELAFSVPTSAAFRGDASHFSLDLRRLSASSRIVSVDVTQDTTHVVLAPDEPTFPDVLTPSTNGQSVIDAGAWTAGDADVYGEYAAVTFSMTPPGGVPLRDAYVEGSWGGWSARRVPMRWNAETRRHEATTLVKQGRHEYRYVSTDARLARAQATVLGRTESAITALVFYRDVRQGTDRLLAAPTFVVRP